MVDGPPTMKCLIEGIKHKARMGSPAYPPTDDAASKSVDHKSDVDEALPGRQWSKKRGCASPPRTVRAPFSAYGSLFKLGPWP
jgi:hypothetical protein